MLVLFILLNRVDMEKSIKENFSVFGRTTLRKFGKMKIYIEGLSRVFVM